MSSTATRRQRRRKSLQVQRRAAKIGIVASMGVLLWTAMGRNRRILRYHTLAGITMMGFSVWHLMLYNNAGHKEDC